MKEDKEAPSQLIDVSRLRVGLYIELGLGWMSHPFPTGSFKIVSDKQIQTIRGLGLKQVRYVPSKSDPEPEAQSDGPTPSLGPANAKPAKPEADPALEKQRRARGELLSRQLYSLKLCEERFAQATDSFKKVLDGLLTHPEQARGQCESLVTDFVTQMSSDGDSAIRLLSESMGDRMTLHPMNVSILALLLGKAMGLGQDDMKDLGMSALLHDIGKLKLPDQVRWRKESFSSSQFKLFQDHVSLGVAMAKGMGLSEGALLAIAQHHELADGSGFPGQFKAEHMTLPAKIVALVNRYEELCNMPRSSGPMTPHESLSYIFAQQKSRFDPAVLSAFIRMMGVYPPGSVIQLQDGRYAIVVSVNASRPLKPRLIVHEPSVAKHEALVIDLEAHPEMSIRRCLRPSALPDDVLDYLAPRTRISYYFEGQDETSTRSEQRTD